DVRYKNLEGQSAITPIFKRQVPILPDVDVAIDKGTGLVMCCTFGDIQDITWWRRHSLPIVESIDLGGMMLNAGKYTGMKVNEAKRNILEDLKALGLLVKQEEITQFVKCAERSGAPLEIITTSQWYISVLEHKEKFLA